MKILSLPAGTAARILTAFGFGFFLSMFTRAVSNIIKQPIMTDLGLSEEVLSLALGTSFFVAFGLMQLPLGVLLDRYDPRRVTAGLFTIAGLGSAIFAGAQDASTLALGRALMGLGFAGGAKGLFPMVSSRPVADPQWRAIRDRGARCDIGDQADGLAAAEL